MANVSLFAIQWKLYRPGDLFSTTVAATRAIKESCSSSSNSLKDLTGPQGNGPTRCGGHPAQLRDDPSGLLKEFVLVCLLVG
jgi:hypothetical protein